MARRWAAVCILAKMAILAIGPPSVGAEAVNAAIMNFADVLIPYLPRVHAKPMHPSILPLALKLVTGGEAVCATP